MMRDCLNCVANGLAGPLHMNYAELRQLFPNERTRIMRFGFLLAALLVAGCATGPRDDYKLRRDIADLHIVKMPIGEARTLLANHKFTCEKDTAQYAGSLLRTVICARRIQGIGCRDDELVTLEFSVDTNLVERLATGRKNGCN
jgi:hypothetical protein